MHVEILTLCEWVDFPSDLKVEKNISPLIFTSVIIYFSRDTSFWESVQKCFSSNYKIFVNDNLS